MARSPKVLIDFDLFTDLYDYACRHPSLDDPQFERICFGVTRKLEAMMRHDLYSLYKSGADEKTREKARLEYLDAIGLFPSFRWPTALDVNVLHSDIDAC